MITNEVLAKTLRTVFWNCNSLLSNRWDLYQHLKNLDIIICVETWLTKKEEIDFPGFKHYRRDRPAGRGGGIAFFIRKYISYSELDCLVSPDDSVELCGINITSVQSPMALIV